MQLLQPTEPNASWILPILSHFHASLVIQPEVNESHIMFEDRCQTLNLLGSNYLNCRRGFSHSMPERHRHRMSKKWSIIISWFSDGPVSYALTPSSELRASEWPRTLWESGYDHNGRDLELMTKRQNWPLPSPPAQKYFPVILHWSQKIFKLSDVKGKETYIRARILPLGCRCRT